ncbi:MAG: hypothetical protein NTW33_10240 [Methanoregula sp.]|nr:hypothetical protein [Methanoregula sp.]
MDNIDRSQIGKRKETAHEQINHPKIPKTNLPPMKAKGVDDKYNWLLSPYIGIPKEDKKEGFPWGLVIIFIICLVIVVTKFFGVW